jgi:hypothetical protein
VRKLQTKSIIEKESKPPRDYTNDFMAFMGWQLITHTEISVPPLQYLFPLHTFSTINCRTDKYRGVLPREAHAISCFEKRLMISSFQPSNSVFSQDQL